MFTINALVQRTLIVGLAVSAAACSSLPPASTPMPLGVAAAPPMGYVQFCERQASDCGDPTPPELTSMRLAAETARSRAAVAAISFDWTSAFGPARASAQGTSLPAASRSPASVTPARVTPARVTPANVTPVTFDWSAVFPQAQRDLAASSGAPAGETPQAKVPPMNRETWSLLQRVNTMVNETIRPREDIQTYGVADYWTTPLEHGEKYGDCEDYVLEKRRQLAAAGVPSSALSIALVLTARGESHAVLVVATSTGEYVLDNRTPWILPWAQTDYRWRERQVAGSTEHWAFAALPARRPAAAASFLLASAR